MRRVRSLRRIDRQQTALLLAVPGALILLVALAVEPLYVVGVVLYAGLAAAIVVFVRALWRLVTWPRRRHNEDPLPAWAAQFLAELDAWEGLLPDSTVEHQRHPDE